MHEGTQGMHPIVILDPNSNALSGQVALKYMKSMALQAVFGHRHHFLEINIPVVADASSFLEANKPG